LVEKYHKFVGTKNKKKFVENYLNGLFDSNVNSIKKVFYFSIYDIFIYYGIFTKHIILFYL
jgi:hypothetical protein